MIRPALLLILLVCASHGQAQMKPMDVASVARLRAQLKDANAATRSITADFLQEKEMTMMQEKMTSEGKFYFRKEKQLRWEYIYPYRYIIIINNDQVTVSEESRTSTFNAQSRGFREINQLILSSISGNILDDDKNFTCTFSDTPGAAVVSLKPISAGLKGVLTGIVLWIDKKTFTVNKLELTEANGDKTRITFTEKLINTSIPDDKFRAP